MSISTEIQRLQTSKANIKAAIENKGVTVGDGTIDTYVEKIGEISGGGSGSNVGYKTSEVKITSNVTNAKALFDIIFNNIDLNHNCVAYLSYPQETNYIYNQITFLSNTDGVKRGVRYRDDVYNTIEIAANYDAAVTIGDIYTVVDLDEYVEDKDYEQGYEDGKNSVGNPLEYATKLYQTYMSTTFPNDYEISIDVPNILAFNSTFSDQSNLKKIKISGNINNNTVDMDRMCYSADTQTLEEIDFSNFNLNVSNMRQAFHGNQKLKTILGTFDLTNCTNVTNSFGLCVALEEVKFVKESIFISIAFANSANLSTDTIQSIIDGLADLTGGTAQTLTLHANVGAKLSDEQKATITAKNWTLVY